MSKILLRETYADFLSEFRWNWFCTLTFRNPPHPESAFKKFKLWVHFINRRLYGRSYSKKKKSIYWCLALEYHKSGVIHFHALLGDNDDLEEKLSRIWCNQVWQQLSGFANISRVETTKNNLMVSRYCSKYILKGGEVDFSDNLKEFRNFHQINMANPKR